MDERNALIRKILMTEWDPVGVREEPAAADEYDEYVPAIERMLREEVSVSQLAEHLQRIAADAMGLRPDPDNSRSAAEKLIALRST